MLTVLWGAGVEWVGLWVWFWIQGHVNDSVNSVGTGGRGLFLIPPAHAQFVMVHAALGNSGGGGRGEVATEVGALRAATGGEELRA